MPSQSKVCFFYECTGFSLENRAGLKAFIETLFKKEGQKLEALNYIFCSDKRLLDINRQYLAHDFYTDIITFDLSAGPATTGEIYISIDRVRDNAKTLGTTFKSELHRVIFHGALHLCGYGDKKKEEIATMRKREDYWLSRYFSN
ncbi:MAG: rRNA maturation RNase YbeY [Sphingobacteriales bacterium]|nr:rRNA maturation RNase YbeY [Sphingobacteriales bacterium]